MVKKTVILGAGMAGLTAAAYLARSGRDITLVERSEQCGGLVQSYWRDGFLFDVGPRAIGNAGILLPMLADLGIDLPTVPGLVSVGMGREIVHFDDPSGMDAYIQSLRRLFPGYEREILVIKKKMLTACRAARTLKRLPNPYFKNPLADPGYLLTRFIPWLPSFLGVLIYHKFRGGPVEETLRSLCGNAALNDMIVQHFFKGTPAPFALGYSENFLDYLYPLGGTGELPKALERKILAEGGELRLRWEARRVIPSRHEIISAQGESIRYDRLIWAADLKSLYRMLAEQGLSSRTARGIAKEKKRYASAASGESVFTLFLAVDEQPEAFSRVSRGHCIYTPRAEGLGTLRGAELERLKSAGDALSRGALSRWLADFCAFNSYEISLPVLKDPTLAPSGKTGLVVSVLFDGELTRLIERKGWLAEFREEMADRMVDALEGSIYPGLRAKIIFRQTATPLTLERNFLTDSGAITGWSLAGKPPVASNLASVFSAVRTAIPGVLKAGQWSYSPSGVPIAILTGRIAASAATGGRKARLSQRPSTIERRSGLG